MSALTLILIAVGLIEIFGFIIALYTLTGIIKQFRHDQEKFKADTLDNLIEFLQLTKKSDKSAQEIFDNISQQNNLICEQYKTISSQYNIMSEVFKAQEDRYITICDHYSTLLNAWKNVEERYSDCYEQLKYLKDWLAEEKALKGELNETKTERKMEEL